MLSNGQPDVISVGRILSEWSAADVTNNELKITYTVFNQQEVEVEGVLLTTSLQPGVTLQSATISPDQDGQRLAWSLGTLAPFAQSSVELTVSFDAGIPLQIDGGAEAFGALDVLHVSDSANPAMLRSATIDPMLLAATPDANWQDPYIAAKAAQLDQDPDNIFEYMKTVVGFESYVGSLRGARGTLWSSAGNAIDEASLMIALLRASGVPAGYAAGTLDDAHARELILSMFPPSNDVIGVIPAGTEVTDPGNDPELLAEARQHYWVQYDVGGVMHDADPTFADAQLDEVFVASVDSTFAEVPDDLRHKVTVRLDREIASVTTGILPGLSPLGVENVLDVTFTAPELVGKFLTIGHFVNQNGLNAPVVTSLTNIYAPYLVVADPILGSDAVESFIRGTDYQEIITNFPLSTTLFTGLFLEIDLSGPDGPTETLQRTLFDRIGFDLRQNGGTPQFDIDTTNATPAISPFAFWTLNISASQQSAIPSPFIEAATALAAQEAAALDESSPQMEVENLMRRLLIDTTRMYLEALLLASDGRTELLANDALIRAYFDRPRVTMFSAEVPVDGDTASMRLEVDLRRDTIRALAAPGQNALTVPAFQAARGISESVIEASIFPDDSTVPGVEVTPPVSTSTVFTAAQQQRIPIIGLSAENAIALDALPIAAEAKARISLALAEGKLVAVPAEPVLIGETTTSAWYEIDPQTGETISVGQNGGHLSEFAESSLLAVAITFVGFPLLGAIGGVVAFETRVIPRFLSLKSEYYAKLLKESLKDGYKIDVNLLDRLWRRAKVAAISDVQEDIFDWIERWRPLVVLPTFYLGFFGTVTGLFDDFKAKQKDPQVPDQLLRAGVIEVLPASIAEADLNVATAAPSGAVTGTADVGSLLVEGDLDESWSSASQHRIRYDTFSATSATVRDGSGVLVGTGAVAAQAQSSDATATGSVDYHVVGHGTTRFDPPGPAGLMGSTQWDQYTANLTGTITLELTTGGLLLGGVLLPAGTYSITTSAAQFTGTGATLSPNFGNAVTLDATEATVHFGAGAGSLSIGASNVDLDNDLAMVGFTGSLQVAPAGTLDSVTVNGSASQWMQLAGSPAALVTDQNTPVSFDFDLATSLADTYTISASAPPDWHVAIDDTGRLEAMPAPGQQGGSATILLLAISQSDPTLRSFAEVNVNFTPTVPAVTLGVERDVAYFLDEGGAQVPTAFLATLQNLGPAEDTFTVSASSLPAGFELQQSKPQVTLGPGESATLGLYLRPTAPLPPPNTVLSFDVTVQSVSDGAIQDTQTVNYTIPGVHGVTVSANETQLSTTPGVAAEVEVTVTSVGNLTEDVTFIIENAGGLSVAGLSDITLAPGEQHVFQLTLTPDAGVPFNSQLTSIITADFGTEVPSTIAFVVTVAAPGVVSLNRGAVAADALGHSDLASRMRDLSIALNNLVQQPGDPVFKSQSLASLDSILTLLAQDAKLADFVDPLTVARDELAVATTEAECLAAIESIGNVLEPFATVITNLAQHDFQVTLFPNSQIAHPLVPVDYGVRIQNVGMETTTYDLDVSGLAANVTSQFADASLTIDPGQFGETILTLTQTSDTELELFDFSVDVSVNGVTPMIEKSAAGTMQARREFISVTAVDVTPLFVDPDSVQVGVMADLLNAVNGQRDVNVAFTVDDPNGQEVFASAPVAAQLTVLTSSLTVDLGTFDTSGFAEGQYTIEVTVAETAGDPIPGANKTATLLIGSPITASLDVSSQVLPPGTSTVTNSLQIDATVLPAGELELIGQLTETGNPSSPVPVNAFDVAVNGDYAYLGKTFFNVTLDVSDPTNPTVLQNLGPGQEFEIVGNQLISVYPQSGETGVAVYTLADASNPGFQSSTGIPYVIVADLAVSNGHGFFSTNLLGLSLGDVTEQFGDVVAVDLTTPFPPKPQALTDVLFNTFGTTSDGDEIFGLPRNGGPFNMFQMALPDANTLYVTSTTSTGTDVNTDEFGQPAEGIIRIVDITDPTDISQTGTLTIPGTTMVQGIALDGDRAYVVGSQGGWRDPYTDVNDIGPVGNIVIAVLDISDIANPQVIGTPTVINRSARGISEVVAVGHNRFAFGSLGSPDDPQLFLIDASDPANPVVDNQIVAPGVVRRLEVTDGLLYVAADTGLFIYSLGGLDESVTASVQIPNNTGVAVVPGSFNPDPTNVIAGPDFDTLVWDLTLSAGSPSRTITFDTMVTDLAPGESRAEKLGATIDFTSLGAAGQLVLPGVDVFAEQILALDPAAQTVQPGEPATFDVTVVNPTQSNEIFDLSVLGVPAEWVDLAAQVTVPAGDSVTVPLTLTSDPFAPLSDFGFVVSATGSFGGSVEGTLTLSGDLVLPAAQPEAHGVVISLDPTQATAGQGTAAHFVAHVTNTGSVADTFALSTAGLPAGFTATFEQTSIEVPPGASNFREVTLTIVPSVGTPPGDYPFSLTADSTSHATISDAVGGTLTVVASGVDVQLTPAAGPPNSTFNLIVTNTGSAPDTFDLSVAAPAALVSALQMASLSLNPGESQTVGIDVGEIDFAFPGPLNLVGVATSQTNSAVMDSDVADVTIAEFIGVATEFDPPVNDLPAPGMATLLLLVDNIGNVEDEYSATIVGTSGPITANLRDLNGDPVQTVPLFILPGFSTGALFLDAELTDLGTGSVTVEVVSLTDDAVTSQATAYLTTEPLDYGDAPLLPSYPTLRVDDGARHVPHGPFLGTVPPDIDDDGQPDAGALGDDGDADGDDEDGVVLPAIITVSAAAAGSANVDVTLSNADPEQNLLNAWIDWNLDGDWDDAGEQIFTDFDLGTSDGTQTISFMVPQDIGENVATGRTFARFRLDTGGGLLPTGAALDGEVEDYALTLQTSGCSTIVTNTSDSGAGSLRAAIDCANATPGADGIVFDIPGAGVVHTIAPMTNLPALSEQASIDGTSQPGYTGTPLIRIDGSLLLGLGGIGLQINSNAAGSIIRGLNLVGMFDKAIYISRADDVRIEANFIGTDATGAMPDANGNNVGVFIINGAGNTVGGHAAAQRNLIGGNTVGVTITGRNATNNIVSGNFIGTDIAGTIDIGNATVGVEISHATGNTIGGNGETTSNVISGNKKGVEIRGANSGANKVQGNLIGTDAAGTGALGNNFGVVIRNNSQSNLIGGDRSAGEGNVISGNHFDGVYINNANTNMVRGNAIGTDAAGTSTTLGNARDGVELSGTAQNNLVGGASVQLGNLLSGNGHYGVKITADNNHIQGNRIGTSLNGNSALGNSRGGVLINSGSGNTIGGANTVGSTAGNQISGNASAVAGVMIQGTSQNNIVLGNLIGTNGDGTLALPNLVGVRIRTGGMGNTLGGDSTAGEGNVISGNTADGVIIRDTDGTSIFGNMIGTTANGANPLGNGNDGVEIDNSQNITVGATGQGQGNVISGNLGAGVRLLANGIVIQANRIGTNADGSAAIPNGEGVVIAGNGNTIGGSSTLGEGNQISGNHESGVRLDEGAAGNTVAGNLIGVDAGATSPLGNKYGVFLLDARNNVVGGVAAGDANVISGNALHGVFLKSLGATNNRVEGNLIGANADGNAAMANGANGVLIEDASGNTIGGDAMLGAGNIISGNHFDGVKISGTSAIGNTVSGNLIGTDATGTTAIPNRNGIRITDDASKNIVGDGTENGGNTIADNDQRGVWISSGTGNTVRRNSIHDNGGESFLGIDLGPSGVTANDAPDDADVGANKLQNSPIIQSIAEAAGGNLEIEFQVGSAIGQSDYDLTIEFFIADTEGQEGATFLGGATYAAASAGNATIVSIPAGTAVVGNMIVATATDANGNTSEFSMPLTVTALVMPGAKQQSQASRASKVESREPGSDELLTILDAATNDDLMLDAFEVGHAKKSLADSLADAVFAEL